MSGVARLTLRVVASKTTEVDATVLRGMHLLIVPEGGQEFTLGEAEAGRIEVAAGTTIERPLEIELNVPADPRGVLRRVSLTWPNLAGAEATVQIAPDQRGIDVGSLDLTKTRAMLITNRGDMTLSFLPDKAPNHVENFLELCKSGFYDGTRFHRVIRDFVIQGGCPNTKEGVRGLPGTGGPDRAIDAEFNDVEHVKGVLSMARGPDVDSGGSQFFICHGDALFLDGHYTAFGKLEAGEDTLDRIADVPVIADRRGEVSLPVQPVALLRAVVLPVAK